MKQERDNNSQQGGMNGRSNNQQQEKNQTLQEGSASSVADYGRSSQNLEEQHGMNSGRQGNSSIPMENDETMGNP